jgi:hypothetical protein
MRDRAYCTARRRRSASSGRSARMPIDFHEEVRMNVATARRCISALALAVASLALLAVLGSPAELQAANYSCQSGASCPYQASCEGAYFDRSGCTVTCFIQHGEQGEIQAAGSASCGGGGGGGGGGNGGDWWCGSEWCW